MTRHPLPSTGFPRCEFPSFIGTMRCYDSRPSIPPCFVSFAWRYHPRPCASLPSTTRVTSKGRGLVLIASLSPWRLFSDGNDRASHVPGEPRLCLCPALRPRQDRSHQACTMRRRGPRSKQDEGSHEANFGAQSHGLGTGCLRFAGWIAPPPRKTRFRLPARLYRTGLATRRVPTKGFRVTQVISSSFPKLRGASFVSQKRLRLAINGFVS